MTDENIKNNEQLDLDDLERIVERALPVELP